MSSRSDKPASQLRFDRVSVRLGEPLVLDEVSFAISRGEVVGLLGRNGAGKTTVVRAANRSVTPEAGQILLDEHPFAEQSQQSLARQIASVPQEMHVPFPFTAGEIVLMGRSPYQGLFGFDSASDLEL
ncbi:ABC transporter ATP-binding protein, partial [Myxococcota bacterium]|nr:ABC transporter ATP-binding protein [Myxococcota bacterium]